MSSQSKTVLIVDSATQSAQALVEQLKALQPEMVFGTYPISDYDQYAELDAPDALVCFGTEEGELDYGLIDPRVDMNGDRCEPDYWGLREEVKNLIINFNKVDMLKYQSTIGPRATLIERAEPMADDLKAILEQIPQQAVKDTPTKHQMADLVEFASRLGLTEAAFEIKCAYLRD